MSVIRKRTDDEREDLGTRSRLSKEHFGSEASISKPRARPTVARDARLRLQGKNLLRFAPARRAATATHPRHPKRTDTGFNRRAQVGEILMIILKRKRNPI